MNPPEKGGYWIPLARPMRKEQLPDGRDYLRSGLRDAWAYCIERDGRILTRMLVVRMDPSAEEMIGVPMGQLTSEDLRDIRLGTVDAHVRKVLPKMYPDLFSKALLRRLRNPAPLRYERRSSEWHADIAELYLRALQEEPRKPVVWMTAAFNQRGHKTEQHTMREWVNAARKKGFLTPGRRGLPGGSPGPELIKRRQEQNRTRTQPGKE